MKRRGNRKSAGIQIVRCRVTRKGRFWSDALSAGVLLAVMTSPAAAQAVCDATEFSTTTGQIYLNAESELLQNDDAAAALAELNKLRSMELNCYERGAMLRLSANINMDTGDNAAAVRDLEEAIRIGAISGDQVLLTYYNIAQLYMVNDDIAKARDYMERWLDGGGQPGRDQNWQLAILYQKLENYQQSVVYAERVLDADGENAERQVLDFLLYLYDRTGDRVKKAELLERLLDDNPNERRLWDVVSGLYFENNEERKAFEVQKAMYLADILQTEDELMRIVNFYNSFNTPYEAAKVLEREMNRGRISRSGENMELLADLFQVSREFERAIPVIRQAAQIGNSGEMYKRLGRSCFELGQYEDAVGAFQDAIRSGGHNEPGYTRVLIGQSLYELDRKDDAADYFREATEFADGRQAGAAWLGFLRAERVTEIALQRSQLEIRLHGLENEKSSCDEFVSLGKFLPETCTTIDARLGEVLSQLEALPSA